MVRYSYSYTPFFSPVRQNSNGMSEGHPCRTCRSPSCSFGLGQVDWSKWCTLGTSAHKSRFDAFHRNFQEFTTVLDFVELVMELPLVCVPPPWLEPL